MLSKQTTPVRTKLTHQRHWDYVAPGLAFVVLAAAAFVPSLVNPVGRMAPVNLLVAIHGVLSTTWLLLFVVQAALVVKGRVTLHRRLGAASLVLAVLMVVTGYQTVIELTRRGFDLSGDLHLTDTLTNAVFPLGDLVSFVTLFGAGLWHRHHPETHKRFMLLATIGMMMPATVAHLIGHNLPDMPVLVPALLGLLFLAPAVYERFRFGRYHRITLWGGIGLFIWGNLRALVIGPNAEWRRFVAWLIS